jgi:hypothetical protein
MVSQNTKLFPELHLGADSRAIRPRFYRIFAILASEFFIPSLHSSDPSAPFKSILTKNAKKWNQIHPQFVLLSIQIALI